MALAGWVITLVVGLVVVIFGGDGFIAMVVFGASLVVGDGIKIFSVFCVIVCICFFWLNLFGSFGVGEADHCHWPVSDLAIL